MQTDNHAVGASRHSKTLSAVLAGVLAVGMIPTTAFAQAAENDSPAQADAIVALAEDDAATSGTTTGGSSDASTTGGTSSSKDGETTATTPVTLTAETPSIPFNAEQWTTVLPTVTLTNGKTGTDLVKYEYGTYAPTTTGTEPAVPAAGKYNVTGITVKSTGTTVGNTAVAMATTYTLAVTIPGEDGKAQAGTAELTIAPFKLSDYTAVAKTAIQPVSVGTLPSDVSDFTFTPELPANIAKSLKVSSNAPATLKAGAYTYTIASTGTNASSITGSLTAPVTVVGAIPAANDFIYTAPDGAVSSITSGAEYTIDVAEGESMTAADFSVKDASIADALSLKVTKPNETTVLPASVLSTPGTYSVTVVIDPAKTSYAYAGQSNPFKVTVNNAKEPVVEVSEPTGYVYYDGKLVNSSESDPWSGPESNGTYLQYTGKNLAGNLTYAAKNADGQLLTQGSDYTTIITDSDKNIVTSIVNAGVYTVSFVSSKYPALADDTAYIEVLPAQMTGLRISNPLFTSTASGLATFAPTKSGVVPTFEYTTATDPTAADATWQTLPVSAYKLAYEATGDSKLTDGKATDAGSYKVTVTLNAATDEAPQNYAFATGTDSTIDFAIQDIKQFEDVPDSAWYTDDVYNAVDDGYMRGYADTNKFGPNDTLTRAQAAVIFYNMGGGDANLPKDDYDKTSDFPDVAGSMWYTTQINWAKTKGVVTGFTDTGLFAPAQDVTREQFVTMMVRFAKLKGIDTTAKDVEGTLAKYVDGASVASWARNDVAWAVEQGLYGVNTDGYLWPKDNLTRAQAAAMAIRQQPKPLTGSEVLVPPTTTDKPSADNTDKPNTDTPSADDSSSSDKTE